LSQLAWNVRVYSTVGETIKKLLGLGTTLDIVIKYASFLKRTVSKTSPLFSGLNYLLFTLESLHING